MNVYPPYALLALAGGRFGIEDRRTGKLVGRRYSADEYAEAEAERKRLIAELTSQHIAEESTNTGDRNA